MIKIILNVCLTILITVSYGCSTSVGDISQEQKIEPIEVEIPIGKLNSAPTEPGKINEIDEDVKALSNEVDSLLKGI